MIFLPAGTAIPRDRTVAALMSASIEPYNEALQGFRSTCGCEVKAVYCQKSSEEEIGKEIRDANAEAVLAIGMDAFSDARKITEVPTVYAMVPEDMVSGGNFRGVSMSISPEVQIDEMMEVFPAAKRIGIVYDPRSLDSFVSRAVSYAASHGISIVSRKAYSPGEVEVLLAVMKGKIDLLWMLPDITVVTPETVESMLLFSFQNKVPIFSFSRKYVEMGAVASLGIDPFDLGAQAGEIVSDILDGKTSVPDRAEARKTVLTINSKMARKLGIIIGRDVIKGADDVL